MQANLAAEQMPHAALAGARSQGGQRRPQPQSLGSSLLNWALALRASRRPEVSSLMRWFCQLSSKLNLSLFLQNLLQEVYFSRA